MGFIVGIREAEGHETSAVIVSPQNRLPSLDGWRAIAILLVLLSHWWATVGAEQIPSWVGLFTKFGELGVRIFLVLSGFLITHLLLSENIRNGFISLKKFYIRRALRIFPVYFAFIFSLAFLALLGIYKDDVSTWIGALTFTRNVIGQGDSATAHLWSLAVEEQFYIIWPSMIVIFKLGNRPRIAVVALLGAAVSAFAIRLLQCTGHNFVCTRVLGVKSLLLFMDSLAIGCIFAYIFTYSQNFLTKLSDAFFPILILFIICLYVKPASPIMGSIMVLAQSILAAICMVLTIVSKPIGAFWFLNSWPIVIIGTLSYSIYIWHGLFLAHYMKLDNPAFFYDWRIWFLPAIALAACSYYFFERPLLRLRGRFRR